MQQAPAVSGTIAGHHNRGSGNPMRLEKVGTPRRLVLRVQVPIPSRTRRQAHDRGTSPS